MHKQILSVLVLLSFASPCSAGIIFDMRPRSDIFTGAVMSASMMESGLTADFASNIGWLRAGGSTFGIDQNGDTFTSQLDDDTFGNREAISVQFDQAVTLNSIDLSAFAGADNVRFTIAGNVQDFGTTSGPTFVFNQFLTPSDSFTVEFLSGDGFSFDAFDATVAVPEPSSGVLACFTCGAFVFYRRKRIRNADGAG